MTRSIAHKTPPIVPLSLGFPYLYSATLGEAVVQEWELGGAVVWAPRERTRGMSHDQRKTRHDG